MKINRHNYYETIEKIGLSSLSPVLKKGHEFIERITRNNTNWNTYQTYKKTVDMQFEAIGLLFANTQKPSTQTPKTKASDTKNKYQPKTPTKTTPVKKMPMVDEEDVPSEQVELISPEVAFMKRFASFNHKTKTKEQIGSFIRSLQKAIAERRIRKTSPHAKLINEIQKELIERFNERGKPKPFEFTPKQLQAYAQFGKSELLYPSIRFIKAFIGLNGKDITKDKAITLHDRIVTAIEKERLSPKDKYFKHIEHILSALKKFVKESRTAIPITEAQLNGLEGVLSGCGCADSQDKLKRKKRALNGLEGVEQEKPDKPENGIMSSTDFSELKFDTIGFMGKWKALIGDPSEGFTAMVFGMPKMGKSYFCIDWASYLSKHHGKVLYIAKEEFMSSTLAIKLNEKKAANDNLDIAGALPGNLSPYQFIFLDSVTSLKLTPDDLTKLEQQYPDKSFIYVFQVAKNGTARGTNEFMHNVDVVVEIPEKGKAVQFGRFNQGGEMDIFE